MADIKEAVRRLLYQFRTEGADGVIKAQEQIASATTTTDKAALSLEKSFNNLERRYVATIRHQQDYQKTQDRVNAAVAQNPALQERANVLLAAAKAQFDHASVAAGRFAAVQTELQAASAGFASGLGPVGTILGRLGPVGLAAGAGIGVAVLALTKMISAGKHLADEAGKMVDFSETIGLNTTALQALKKAGAEVGIEADKVTTSFEKFSVQVDEAQQGSGTLYEALKRINPELAQEMVLVKDVAKAWDVLNRAREQAGTIEQKNALARAAFGRGGLGMGRLQDVSSAAGGIQALTAGMNNLNSLTEDELKRLDQLGDKITQVSHEAEVNFTKIFAGPALTASLAFQMTLLDISHLLLSIGKLFPGAPPKQTGYDQASIAEPTADQGRAAGHSAAAQAMTAEQQATINLGIAQQQLTSIYGGVSVAVATRLLQMQMESNMAMQLDQLGRNAVTVEIFAQGVRLQKLTTMEQEALITQKIISLNTQLAASFLQSSQQRMISMRQQVQAAQLELAMMDKSNEEQTKAQLLMQMTNTLNAEVIQKYGERGLAAIQAGNAEVLAEQMAIGVRQQLADAIVAQINNLTNLEAAIASGTDAEIRAAEAKVKAQEEIIKAYQLVIAASDEKAAAVVEGYRKEQAEIQATAAALAALREKVAVNTQAAADSARVQVQAQQQAQRQAQQTQRVLNNVGDAIQQNTAYTKQWGQVIDNWLERWAEMMLEDMIPTQFNAAGYQSTTSFGTAMDTINAANAKFYESIGRSVETETQVVDGIPITTLKPVRAAMEDLVNTNEDLTKSTDSLNATMQNALSPYYSMDPRTTRLGFRAGVVGNPDWLAPGASNTDPLAAILGAGATAPGMADGGSFVVGGGYSANDNRIAAFPVASGEEIIVNRSRQRGQGGNVINIDNRTVINGSVDTDTMAKLKVTKFQQSQRMRAGLARA